MTVHNTFDWLVGSFESSISSSVHSFIKWKLIFFEKGFFFEKELSFLNHSDIFGRFYLAFFQYI